MKPPRESTPEERRELHLEKMRNKRLRRASWHRSGDVTFLQRQLRRVNRATGKVTHLRVRPNSGNRNSIWPEGKTAKPGRMG